MSELKPVLVTTEFRGVFFGYAAEPLNSPDKIVLVNARNCIYWPVGQGGFMGLASDGPANGARIGAVCDITLYKITSVMPVSEKAAQKWANFEVYRG